MRTAVLSLFLVTLTCLTATAYPQEAPLQDNPPSRADSLPSFPVPPSNVTPPSKEEFVNTIFHTVVDSSFSTYYLIQQSDTCRFVKFNYEDWTQYTLKEPVSIVILNELAEKVYLSKGPYFWRKEQLQKAICISNKQADSVLFYGKATVFSFSQPQFTDDGQYAVIDLNFVCGRTCGQGLTCLFRLTPAGWKRIAKYTNWNASL
jgi:hypothetical protein